MAMTGKSPVCVAAWCVGVALLLWVCVDWSKVLHPEYRRLASYSTSQQVSFEQSLAEGMASRTEVYVRDLVSFDWDTVCVMGGYAHLREDMGHRNAYGSDLPELDLFPSVREGDKAFIFIKDKKSVAVIQYPLPQLRYIFNICADRQNAVLTLIDSKATVPFEVQKSNHYVIQRANIKKYEGCKGRDCDLIFDRR
ncbi:MAG: hypothetical protein V4735_08705 [Pseudomonadota bacterium]